MRTPTNDATDFRIRSLDDVDAVAWAIDADGIEAHQHEADEVAQLATEAAIAPTVVAVLRDRNTPSPVRERAFGLVAVALARAGVGSGDELAFAN